MFADNHPYRQLVRNSYKFESKAVVKESLTARFKVLILEWDRLTPENVQINDDTIQGPDPGIGQVDSGKRLDQFC